MIKSFLRKKNNHFIKSFIRAIVIFLPFSKENLSIFSIKSFILSYELSSLDTKKSITLGFIFNCLSLNIFINTKFH